MVRPATPLLLLAAVAGCTMKNPGFDEPTATTRDPTDPSTSAAPAATTGSDAGSTAVAPTTGSPATTTLADTTLALADTSTGTTGTSTGTTGPDDTTSASTTDATTGPPPEPEPEHLQLYDPDRCDEPLWCYDPMEDVFAGVPAEMTSQACFTPKTPPPYALKRVGYRIAASFNLDKALLLVTARGPGGPGPTLLTVEFGADQLGAGAFAWIPPQPIVISEPGFCLGLVGGSQQAGSGLGVAIDPDALIPDQSYGKAVGPPMCNYPDWTDVFDVMVEPKGAWCIDATIEPAP